MPSVWHTTATSSLEERKYITNPQITNRTAKNHPVSGWTLILSFPNVSYQHHGARMMSSLVYTRWV